ncbi:MAG: nitrogen-specific signal transduction histidine kinase, partial [Myxococcota bacterium]
ATSLVAVWLYAPHAFLHLHAADSAPLGDRALELVMFLVVGSVTGLLVERERRAMSGLRAAEQRADELGALMTLTSGLAHEVRNPLSAIQGSLDILSDDLAVGSPPQAIADEALAEVSRLDHALGDFVRFVAPVSPSDADAAPKDDG